MTLICIGFKPHELIRKKKAQSRCAFRIIFRGLAMSAQSSLGGCLFDLGLFTQVVLESSQFLLLHLFGNLGLDFFK